MSGVAKDDTPNNSASETAPAVQETAAATAAELEAAHAEAKAERVNARKLHLRVVTGNEAAAAQSAVEQAPTQRVGAQMRQARETLGYDLEQVSKETRITVSHLRAIEEMTPNLIGEPVYVKGHIRTYARHLRLDADMVLERYLKECALLSDPKKVDIAPPVTGRRMPAALPVMGLLVAGLVVGGGAFVMFGGNSGVQPTPAPVGASSSASAVAGAPTADPSIGTPAVGQSLRIRALRRARIEVRGADGSNYRSRYFSPGEIYAPRVGAGWTVTTPEGDAFEWLLGDVSLGLLAPSGPVYAQSVDAALGREPIIGDLPDPASPSPTVEAPAVVDPNGNVTGAPPVGTIVPRPSGSAAPANRPARPRPVQPSPSASAADPAPQPRPSASQPATDPALAAYPDG
jgi:hypothetical protein